jgi:hypothetical protein
MLFTELQALFLQSNNHNFLQMKFNSFLQYHKPSLRDKEL